MVEGFNGIHTTNMDIQQPTTIASSDKLTTTVTNIPLQGQVQSTPITTDTQHTISTTNNALGPLEFSINHSRDSTSSEKPANPPRSGVPKLSWGTIEVRQLLNVLLEDEMNPFISPYGSNKARLWSKVAEEVKKNLGVSGDAITGQKCKKKFLSLKAKLEQMLEKVRKTSNLELSDDPEFISNMTKVETILDTIHNYKRKSKENRGKRSEDTGRMRNRRLAEFEPIAIASEPNGHDSNTKRRRLSNISDTGPMDHTVSRSRHETQALRWQNGESSQLKQVANELDAIKKQLKLSEERQAKQEREFTTHFETMISALKKQSELVETLQKEVALLRETQKETAISRNTEPDNVG